MAFTVTWEFVLAIVTAILYGSGYVLFAFLDTETSGVGRDYPFSHEKLSPVLGLYKAKDFADAVNIAEALVEFGLNPLVVLPFA